ncbi:MAG: zinc-ribbon domain-containing protein [Pseudomonadota bacterium]
MLFTFECGVCHSVYRLDDKQITPSGVKITCPKCLNYFFLKQGETDGTEEAVVEYIVPDGAYDVSPEPAEAPKEPETADSPLFPVDVEADTLAEPTSGKKRWDSVSGEYLNPFYPPVLKARLTEADLSDYPPDAPPKSFVDHYFWYLTSIFFAAMLLLLLNFAGVVPIPGLESLRHQAQVAQEPAVAPLSPGQRSGKHGFPKVDAGYDPWAGATSLPTPAPEPTTQP